MARSTAFLLPLLLPLLLPTTKTGRGSSAPSLQGSVVVADHHCAAAADTVVSALERVTADSTQAAVTDGLELLKTATDLCSQDGDIWYYRSLFAARLKDSRGTDYALQKAVKFGSDAMNDKLNPFILATPRSASERLASAGGMNNPSKKWALIVGIGSFSAKGIASLQYTAADADSFAQALKDPKVGGFVPENVIEIKDGQATLRGIKEKLNFIARNAGPNDIVVIYVASHGFPHKMDSIEGINYIVTFDTEFVHDGKFSEDTLYSTAFPMVELANDVATRMQSLRTLIVLDTCYSGGAFKAVTAGTKNRTAGAGLNSAMLQRFGQGTGRIIMAASQDDETSQESEKLGHGYFTYYLLQALQKSGGKEPLGQLFTDVAGNVTHEAEATGYKQHPVIYKSATNTDFALNSGGVL